MTTPDWSLAPEGATHFNPNNALWYRPGRGLQAEAWQHVCWSPSAFANADLSATCAFIPRPMPQCKENAMHTITELTMRDLLDRAAIFAERALELVAQCAPYTYVDFSRNTNTVDPLRWPLALVHITLAHSTPGNPFPPLRLHTGEQAQHDCHIEGSMLAQRDAGTVTLRLPLAAIANQSFMRRLFDMTDDTHQETHFCIYARNWRNQIDTLSESMPDYTETRWRITSVPTTPSAHPIPQLGSGGDEVRAFIPGDYHSGFTIGTTDPVWRMREQARLAAGHYDPLPQEVAQALDPNKVANAFPHLSIKPGNAGMVAYTESAAKGALDRQSVMKPGRFIRQFGYDHLTDEDVKRLAAKVMASAKLTYHHSRERGDYSRVYQTGPNSCMAYGPLSSRGTFDHTYVDGEFVHPAEVYAHPENNLELVWGEVEGEVVSRAVVNTRTKTYPRIYGKESVARSKEKLKEYLAELGYSQSSDALDDEKLLLLNPDDYPDAIICPYIDPNNRGVDIRADHLVVGGYEQANHETGCLFRNDPAKPTWICACCNDAHDEDEESWVDENGDSICENCLDNHTYAFSLSASESRYVHESCVVYRLLGTITDRTLRHYDYVYEGCSSLGRHGLAELSSDFYDESSAAEREQCVEYEGGDYVLTDDMSSFGLFYDEDGGVARDIDEWAVVRDENGDEKLRKRGKVNLNTHILDNDESSDICPWLPVYVPVAEEDDTLEEAA